LSLHVATDVLHARHAVHLQQAQAPPVAHVRQGQGWRRLLTSVGLTDQEPSSPQGQYHVVMPAVPRAPLVLVHADLAFASWLLLDSRVMDVPMSSDSIVATPLSWNTLFFRHCSEDSETAIDRAGNGFYSTGPNLFSQGSTPCSDRVNTCQIRPRA